MKNSSHEGEAHGDGVMTFKEIGRRLGITRGGAWMLYKSAMRKLRRQRHRSQLDAMRELAQSRKVF